MKQTLIALLLASTFALAGCFKTTTLTGRGIEGAKLSAIGTHTEGSYAYITITNRGRSPVNTNDLSNEIYGVDHVGRVHEIKMKSLESVSTLSFAINPGQSKRYELMVENPSYFSKILIGLGYGNQKQMVLIDKIEPQA